MKTEGSNKLTIVLVILLMAVVAAQSVVMARLYQKVDAPRQIQKVNEPYRMNIRPRAGGSTSVAPQHPAASSGSFGSDPDLWDPFSEFHRMRQQMDQMFNDSFSRFRMSPDFELFQSPAAFSPSVDLEERDNNYIVRMDIPGAEKSNISVNITDRMLEVSGQINETVVDKGKNQLRKERRSGEFRRALTLPGPVKAGEMEAKYENGVLVVTIPKADEKDEARSIKVR